MILVDTSAWVELFRADSDFDLEAEVELGEVVTCLPVIQEVLQGFDDQRAFRVARESMFALPVVESPMEAEVFEAAVQLYRPAPRPFTARAAPCGGGSSPRRRPCSRTGPRRRVGRGRGR